MKGPGDIVDRPLDLITHYVGGLPELDLAVLYIEDGMDVLVRYDRERERHELRCTPAGLRRLAEQVEQARIKARSIR